LLQNYPNPFNPTTAISYQLSAVSSVKLNVYDALGREVARLVDGQKPAGVHTVVWNAQNCPSGVYVCRMVTGSQVLCRKMLFIK
jgi:flagellar hook assembly protein FlgD